MVSINRSFVYGICFASITWIISLYLYISLNRSESKTATTAFYQNFAKLQAVVKRPNFTDPKEQDLFDLGLIRNGEDQFVKDEGYKIHAYNVLISNRLGLHRDIPDTRHSLCKNVPYEENLPSASVIICFYNEHLHTLLRTIHSILHRTPEALLEEIILVDDYSDLPKLHENLTESIKFNAKIRLLKTDKREGLIRARILGASRSEGEVLVFLDSHIEVNTDWLRPMLARIKEDKRNVVMPVIDIINADTFVYTASPLVRGGFNWGLHFKWENLPKGTLKTAADFVKPIKSPTMAGGLFAIDRNYFKQMGEYDSGMNIWGGENLEISFRIWMCGGNLEIIPCSRVGHIFRQRRPYGSPDGEDTMLYNSLRVAEVWMDNYKEHFLKQRPEARRLSPGDISSRLQLRTLLNCHNFSWYLEHIYPEMTTPGNDTSDRLRRKWAQSLAPDRYRPWDMRERNYLDHYQIRLSNTTLCVQSGKDLRTKGSTLVLRPCLPAGAKHQTWWQTDRNELVLAQLLCLQAGKGAPVLYKCHEMGADQEWRHKGESNSAIYNIAAGTCLAAKAAHVNAPITMKICSDGNFTNFDIVKVEKTLKNAFKDRYRPHNNL